MSRPNGPRGSLRSRPFRKRKRFLRLPSLAAMSRSERPRSRTRSGSDGVRSRKPFGPRSTRKPSCSSVPIFPPGLVARFEHRDVRGGRELPEPECGRKAAQPAANNDNLGH